MHRKKVIHSDGSYEKKSRRRTWLTKWDKVKSHGTLIDWCTGREWPLNCMKVISAWWWSNMPVQRRRKWHIPGWLAMRIDIEWAIELLYNSLKTWSQWVGDQMSERQDAVEKAIIQQRSGPPGLRLSSPGERERHNADDHKSGGQYVAVLFGLQLPLTRKPYNKVRGIFFKRSLRSSYSLRQYVFCMYMCIYEYVLCVCIVNHGHGHYCVSHTFGHVPQLSKAYK